MARDYLWAGVLVCLLTSSSWGGEVTGSVTIQSAASARARGPERRFQGDQPRYANLRGSLGYSHSAPDRNDGPSRDELAREDDVQAVVIELVGKSLPANPLLKPVAGRNVVTQLNKHFSPHVVVVCKGSRVYFQNEDNFLHHIYSDTPHSFEIPEHKRHVQSSATFEVAGAHELFCGLHPRMNAYVYVSSSNFATQPGSNHRYLLRSIPAGAYKVRVWHPRLPEQSKEVNVPEHGSVTLDLKL